MKNKIISVSFEKVKGSVTCWIRFQVLRTTEDVRHEDFFIPARTGRSMIKTFHLKKSIRDGVEHYLFNEK